MSFPFVAKDNTPRHIRLYANVADNKIGVADDNGELQRYADAKLIFTWGQKYTDRGAGFYNVLDAHWISYNEVFRVAFMQTVS